MLNKLTELSISIDRNGNDIAVYDPNNSLTEELVLSITNNKTALLKIIDEIAMEDKTVFIPKAEFKEYYKASTIQKHFYYLNEFDRSSLAYNMPKTLKLKGELDKERLTFVFNKLVDRHESLRTCFKEINGEPIQIILEKIQFEIEYYQSGPEEIQKIIKKFVRPFNLSETPLIRVGLIKVSSEEYVFLMDMHHIITDGSSTVLLLNDLMSIYNNQNLPKLQLQYKDYAEWQQSDQQQKKLPNREVFGYQSFHNF